MSRRIIFISFYLFFSTIFLLSCSDTPNQYSTTLPQVNPDRTLDKLPILLTEPSHADGGQLLYQKTELSEEQKDILVRQNFLVPIIYKNGSAGNISMKTEYEEAVDILNFDFITSSGLNVYREGLAVAWREDPPRTPYVIFLFSKYQGTIDFGPWMGEESRYRKIGHSFTDQFSTGIEDIQKDEKAVHFITSTYKYFTNTEENCLETQQCHLSINPQGNYIFFQFPKMTLLFGNNERRILTQVAMSNNDESSCFSMPFDILNTQFFCGTSDDGSHLTLNLGDSYKEALQKSGINPDLPIIYGNTRFVQITRSTNIGWKRDNFEEEPEEIPENSHLSLVSMKKEYIAPFLIDHSLVKISVTNSNEVSLQLDPLNPTEKQKWTMTDIENKRQAVQSQENTFYLSTSMLQIKDNYVLQKTLIRNLLSLLEETYKTLHPNPEEQFKIYKRVFGEYSDKHALEASGILTIANQTQEKDSLIFEITIDHASGTADITALLVYNNFGKHILTNQNPIDLNQPVTNLIGFTLGDKIYLRDKKIGPATAIVAYMTDNNQTLTTLADYSYEEEVDVIYESGRDKNITFQKAEIINVWLGATLIINPTFQTKEIDNQIFDEYEINGVMANTPAFSEKINNLCKIDNFNIEMGMYDRLFTQMLSEKVVSEKDTSTQTGCSYISPQDHLFSSLNRVYFFPDHKMVLGFGTRELLSVRIYKKPSENKGNSQ